MRQEGVGKALRRAFGQEDLIKKLKPRKAGVSWLMNPKRRGIFVHLLKAPCSHLRQLSRTLGLPTQTTKWHLKELVEAGVLDSVNVGNKKCFFIPSRIERGDVSALAVLADEKNRGIMRLLMSGTPLSQRQIFEDLGTYRQVIQPRLRSLERAGFVSAVIRGRRSTYDIGPHVKELSGKYLSVKSETSKRIRDLLEGDGLTPRTVKTLAKSVVFEIDTDEGRQEIEAFFDPFAILE